MDLSFGIRVNGLTENQLAHLLVIPLTVLIVGLLWIPFLHGIWLSFHEYNLLGDATWVGLANYQEFLRSSLFLVALRTTVLYGVSTTVLQLGIGFIAALAFDRIDWGRRVLAGVFLLPFTLPPVISGLIWLLLLNPDYGPVFGILLQTGILVEPIYWATNGDTAFAAIVLAGTWTFWPFVFLVLSAALEDIPQRHYEVAHTFGASRVQVMRHVVIPRIKNTILIVAALRLIWNLARLSQPLVMTQGGPGFQTSFLSLLSYEMAYSRGAFGKAYAIGLVLYVLMLGVVFVFIRQYRRGSELSEV